MTDATVSMLPHSPPMVMIERGEDLADGVSAAYAVVSPESVFYDPVLGGVPGVAALEYMAQTMAFAVGARQKRRGEEPAVGFVLGSRRLEVAVAAFRPGCGYRVTARCDYADEEFASFDCAITDDGGRVVASAALTACLPKISEQPTKKGTER